MIYNNTPLLSQGRTRLTRGGVAGDLQVGRHINSSLETTRRSILELHAQAIAFFGPPSGARDETLHKVLVDALKMMAGMIRPLFHAFQQAENSWNREFNLGGTRGEKLGGKRNAPPGCKATFWLPGRN